jgi:hypothetical protein
VFPHGLAELEPPSVVELIKVAAPYLTHTLWHQQRMVLMSVRRVPSDSSKSLVGYQVRWRDANGLQRKRLFKGQQKRAAETFHAETIAALSRGQYIDITDKTTVTEYARQWVSIQPYRPASRERRESQIRTHLEPSRLGQMRLVKVAVVRLSGLRVLVGSAAYALKFGSCGSISPPVRRLSRERARWCTRCSTAPPTGVGLRPGR